MVSASLAHYRITAELGRGGMGIVYRALDTKLDRTVALKVLPPHALASADDRARFQREARAAAKLHHPHIASVFEIGEAAFIPDGADSVTTTDVRPFIAMEFVDGDSLAERIAKGPLKLDEAIRLASQIAEALGAAHEAGIVHRDVKSGNVMLTSKGVAKVLDFGLAQTAASTKLTRMGSTLGTVAYMSPEQARGEEVDSRSDLWSVGVVLYEMIAGRLPFVADYEQATLYGILNQDPEPLTAVRTGVPMEIEAIVSKLLRKEARLRYQTAADLIADLESVSVVTRGSGARTIMMSAQRSAVGGLGQEAPGAGQAGGLAGQASGETVRTTGDRPATEAELTLRGTAKWRRYALWFGFVGLLFGSLVTASLFLGSRSTPAASAGDVVRSSILLPPEMPLLLVGDALGAELKALDLSPDGSLLVYSSRSGEDIRLVVRDMRAGTYRKLEETVGARNPSFSPDSREIAYVSGSGIYRVSVDGGRPQFVTEVADGAGLSWGWDGMIYFVDVQGRNLIRVSPEGVREDLEVGETCSCALPSLAPGSFGLIVSGRDQELVFRHTGSGLDTTSIRGNHTRFLSAGFVLSTRTGVLVAYRWDPSSGAIGPADRTVVENLRTSSVTRSAHYSVSESGTLVYAAGSPSGIVNVVIRGPDGTETLVPIPAGVYGPVDVSPDGRRLLITNYDAGGKLQVVDLAGGAPQFVLPDAESRSARWTSAGQTIGYARRSGDRWEIVRARPDGSGTAESVLEADERITPVAWSSDGQWLAYDRRDRSVLAIRDLRDGSERELETPGETFFAPNFSPDSRFVAFTRVGEQGTRIAVAPVPPTGEEWTVPGVNGEEPEWLPDRDALVYRRARDWFIVDVDLGGAVPTFSEPRLLFSGPWVNIAGVEYRMLSGGRALLQRPVNTTETTDRIEVVTNFFAELDRLLTVPNP